MTKYKYIHYMILCANCGIYEQRFLAAGDFVSSLLYKVLLIPPLAHDCPAQPLFYPATNRFFSLGLPGCLPCNAAGSVLPYNSLSSIRFKLAREESVWRVFDENGATFLKAALQTETRSMLPSYWKPVVQQSMLCRAMHSS